MAQKLKILIAGGGTGGHIFPAIAIADQLKKMKPDTEFLFVGANDRMEMEKVPAAGYKIIGLPISGIQRSLSPSNLILVFKLGISLLRSRTIIKKFKPDVVIGVGGYASGPVLYQASRMGIPTLIQEQNNYAGVTNKLLAKKVDKICVAYEGMERFFPAEKIVVTGNPVRLDIADGKVSTDEAHEHYNIKKNKKTILVIGGSLGARTINESIDAAVDQFCKEEIQVLWQTGKSYYDRALHRADSCNKIVRVRAFIKQMPMAYAAADIIISRAGAIAISELCLVGKPVILVPSPNVAEDHQTKNAKALTDKGAAILVKDNEAREKLVRTALVLLENEEQKNELSTKIKEQAKPEAVVRIAEEVISLVKK